MAWSKHSIWWSSCHCFFTQAMTAPMYKSPSSNSCHYLPPLLGTSQRLREEAGLECKVRPRDLLARAGVWGLAHCDPRSLQTYPGLRQRAAAATTYQRSAGAGLAGSAADPPKGGDGRGTYGLPTRAARRYTGPSSRGRQLGPRE